MSEKTNAQLKEEIKVLETRADAFEKKDAQVEKLIKINGDQIAEQKTIIEELTEKLSEKEVEVKVGGVVVSYKKDKYKVLGGQIRMGNQVIKAEDLGSKENAEALEALIENESGFLVKLEKE